MTRNVSVIEVVVTAGYVYCAVGAVVLFSGVGVMLVGMLKRPKNDWRSANSEPETTEDESETEDAPEINVPG